MKNAATILPTYASDTSGVCSALYELGGMTVVHDASGCNSTYSTFDEPRWYDQESMIYISGLTEMDAILGCDTRLVEDCLRASDELSPAFIALAGSPMPMLLGTDFKALAREIEEKSGIPTFAVKTNGIASYLSGASQAFLALVRRFAGDCAPQEQDKACTVNLLGACPLDVDQQLELPEIFAWLQEEGFRLNVSLALNTSLSKITELGRASVNLVLSSSGLALADYLFQRFKTPYVVGKPYGPFAAVLADRLRAAQEQKSPLSRKREAASTPPDTLLIGESVDCASLAEALALTEKHPLSAYQILCPLEAWETVLGPGDIGGLEDESACRSLMANVRRVVADPFYQLICPPETRFLPSVHTAFSGRVFQTRKTKRIHCSLDDWLLQEEQC